MQNKIIKWMSTLNIELIHSINTPIEEYKKYLMPSKIYQEIVFLDAEIGYIDSTLMNILVAYRPIKIEQYLVESLSVEPHFGKDKNYHKAPGFWVMGGNKTIQNFYKNADPKEIKKVDELLIKRQKLCSEIRHFIAAI